MKIRSYNNGHCLRTLKHGKSPTKSPHDIMMQDKALGDVEDIKEDRMWDTCKGSFSVACVLTNDSI